MENATTSEDAIRIAVRSAASLGIPGLFTPGLDAVGMATIWLAMVTTIARRQGADLSAQTAGKLTAAAITSASTYSSGSRFVMLAMHAIPFVAIPVGMAANVTMNVMFTYKLGKACVERFSSPNLTREEVVGIVKRIKLTPTIAEIREIKQMFGG